MTAFPFDCDSESIWSCHKGASSHTERARLFVATDVQPKDVIDFWAVHCTCFNHGLGTSPPPLPLLLVERRISRLHKARPCVLREALQPQLAWPRVCRDRKRASLHCSLI